MQITFYYPGLFFSESSTEEFDNIESIKIPKGCFCFTMAGTKGKYYLGKPYTLENVQQEADELGKQEDYRILISNMEGNGYKRVVKCITQNWQPLEKDDKVFEDEKMFVRYLKLKKLEAL